MAEQLSGKSAEAHCPSRGEVGAQTLGAISCRRGIFFPELTTISETQFARGASQGGV